MWCATWFDGKSRQTRRESLGTADLREAEIGLADFVARKAKVRDLSPDDVSIAEVLLRYWHGHAHKIASHEQAKFAMALWTDFWKDTPVSDLTPDRQEAFIEWLKGRGYKNSYVSRVLSVGRAALNRGYKRQELTKVPYILDELDRSDQEDKVRLTSDQMRRLLTTARDRWPHIFLFCVISLNTLHRPGAVLELRPRQVDLELRRIDFNIPGRKRTKKRRTTVPITDTLLPFLTSERDEPFVNWKGSEIRSVKSTFRRLVTAAGLPKEITPYCLRHTMAAELRRRGVPMWEVEGLLAHKVAGVTETYAKFAPDYLSQGSRAIDAYFEDLGLPFLKPTPDCVPAACYFDESEIDVDEEDLVIPEAWMVGVTGIEPVTPTMST